MTGKPLDVGVISDTHGLLRPEAVDALRGVDVVLHAGDIGKPTVIDALERIAPVHAIRGNVDSGDWASRFGQTARVELAGVTFHLVHDLKSLDADPRSAGIAVVISGHSHQPAIEWREEVLYFNPGSAGPRRFKLPVCLGRLVVGDGPLEPRLVQLL